MNFDVGSSAQHTFDVRDEDVRNKSWTEQSRNATDRQIALVSASRFTQIGDGEKADVSLNFHRVKRASPLRTNSTASSDIPALHGAPLESAPSAITSESRSGSDALALSIRALEPNDSVRSLTGEQQRKSALPQMFVRAMLATGSLGKLRRDLKIEHFASKSDVDDRLKRDFERFRELGTKWDVNGANGEFEAARNNYHACRAMIGEMSERNLDLGERELYALAYYRDVFSLAKEILPLSYATLLPDVSQNSAKLANAASSATSTALPSMRAALNIEQFTPDVLIEDLLDDHAQHLRQIEEREDLQGMQQELGKARSQVQTFEAMVSEMAANKLDFGPLEVNAYTFYTQREVATRNALLRVNALTGTLGKMRQDLQMERFVEPERVAILLQEDQKRRESIEEQDDVQTALSELDAATDQLVAFKEMLREMKTMKFDCGAWEANANQYFLHRASQTLKLVQRMNASPTQALPKTRGTLGKMRKALGLEQFISQIVVDDRLKKERAHLQQCIEMRDLASIERELGEVQQHRKAISSIFLLLREINLKPGLEERYFESYCTMKERDTKKALEQIKAYDAASNDLAQLRDTFAVNAFRLPEEVERRLTAHRQQMAQMEQRGDRAACESELLEHMHQYTAFMQLPTLLTMRNDSMSDGEKNAQDFYFARAVQTLEIFGKLTAQIPATDSLDPRIEKFLTNVIAHLRRKIHIEKYSSAKVVEFSLKYSFERLAELEARRDAPAVDKERRAVAQDLAQVKLIVALKKYFKLPQDDQETAALGYLSKRLAQTALVVERLSKAQAPSTGWLGMLGKLSRR